MTMVSPQFQKSSHRSICCLLAVLLSSVSALQSQTFELPSFKLVMNVEKSEKALIDFQDRLDMIVQQHLESFFKERVELSTLGNEELEELRVSSAYVWREESVGTSSSAGNRYEVKSQFDSEIECVIRNNFTDFTDEEGSQLSPSIVDLLLIEAFQGDNYWNLVHSFLSDIILEDITNLKVTVLSDGFMHYNGQDPSAFDDLYLQGSAWTAAMTLGVAMAILFCFMLVVMWSYLCCFAKKSSLFKYVWRKPAVMEKAESVTDDLYSTSSVYSDEEKEQQWMDDWANAVTSIPLREPIRRKKTKRKVLTRHPAQHHSSILNSIEEADDECSTVVSAASVKSTGERSTRSCRENSTEIPRSKSMGTVPEGPDDEYVTDTSSSNHETLNEVC